MSRGSRSVAVANPIYKRADGPTSKQECPTSGSHRGVLAYILDCTHGIPPSL
jgi:hypothetical protein